MNKAGCRKRANSERAPLCKYGSACYQKNPDHLKKYRHPSGEKHDSQKVVENGSPSKCCRKDEQKNTIDRTDSAQAISGSVGIIKGNTVEAILKNLPEDFLEFWTFCSSVNTSKPQDAFVALGLHLVGPYDLLSLHLSKDKEVNLLCHWRYYYDPPEFQTLISVDGEDLYHIGYFKDDPSERSAIVASNSVALGPKLSLMGDNIFAAVNVELKERIVKLKTKALQKKFSDIQEKLQNYAASKKLSLLLQTPRTKARNKMVNSKTFHGLGIVVPIHNNVGYRPLPDSNAVLKTYLKLIVNAKTEEARLIEEEALDEIITNVHLGNDECDYGMGLELGIDLFCFGEDYFNKHAKHLLTLAYTLLKRLQYAEVIQAHLEDRRKSEPLKAYDSLC